MASWYPSGILLRLLFDLVSSRPRSSDRHFSQEPSSSSHLLPAVAARISPSKAHAAQQSAVAPIDPEATIGRSPPCCVVVHAPLTARAPLPSPLSSIPPITTHRLRRVVTPQRTAKRTRTPTGMLQPLATPFPPPDQVTSACLRLDQLVAVCGQRAPSWVQMSHVVALVLMRSGAAKRGWTNDPIPNGNQLRPQGDGNWEDHGKMRQALARMQLGAAQHSATTTVAGGRFFFLFS